jgi:hypothetical protein
VKEEKKKIIRNIPYHSFLPWTDIDFSAAVILLENYNAEWEALPAADLWNDNLTCFILNASKIMDNLHWERKVEKFTFFPGLEAGWFSAVSLDTCFSKAW